MSAKKTNARPGVRDADEVRADLFIKLNKLVDQARLSSQTTPFMRNQMDDIVNGVVEGLRDTDRLTYLASDRETLRAVYDHLDAVDGTLAEGETQLDTLRETIDLYVYVDADGEFDVA